MAPCACGRVPIDGDRYCAACGADLTPGVAPAPDELILLDGSGRPRTGPVPSEVRAGASRALVAGGTVAVVLLLLVLSSLSSDGGASRLDDNLDAIRDAVAERADRARREAAAIDEAEEELAAALAEAEPAEGDAVAVPRPALTESSYALGEETGLGLVLRSGSAPPVLLDLDTGVETELGLGRVRPLGAIGSVVLFQRDSDGNYLVADLAAAEVTGTNLDPGDQSWMEFVGVVDGLFWTLNQGESQYLARAFNATGEAVDELVLSSASRLPVFPVGLPDLVQSIPGGVYQRSGDGYLRVFDGLLLAAGERIVLVQTCDDELACEYRWYDRATWDRLDHPSPDLGDADPFALSIAGDDRWLVRYDWTRSPQVQVVYEIATGREVVELPPSYEGYPYQAPPVSDDGRWAVASSDGGLRIIDLDGSGTVHAVPGRYGEERLDVIFIDLGQGPSQ